MADMNDYATSFMVDKTAEEVFQAINNVRGWWSGEVDGDTTALGAEFTYQVPEVHWSKQEIIELIPSEKVVWKVLDSNLNFTKAKNEWNGTTVSFEIIPQGDQTEVRFSHVGLVPSFECYGDCSNAWDLLVNKNLRNLILTGETQPSPW